MSFSIPPDQDGREHRILCTYIPFVVSQRAPEYDSVVLIALLTVGLNCSPRPIASEQ